MKWRDLFTSAYHALSQHKLRSSLTLLGIVIGVGAVVAMMSMTCAGSCTIRFRAWITRGQ